MPFIQAGEMVGMFGISNRPGGYDEQVVSELGPFLNTCTNIIQGERATSRQRAAEASLRETEAELSAIHAQIGEGIAALDTEGRFLTANPAAQRMFGKASHELVGVSLAHLLQSSDQAKWVGFLGDFTKHAAQTTSIDVRALRGDKLSEFPLEVMLSRVQLEAGTRIIAVLREQSHGIVQIFGRLHSAVPRGCEIGGDQSPEPPSAA